ncbi:hypothetical protein [Elizabethkingia anophelis]|uniref:hypothetical protein n=1 Tax=Elizabethkingia anophelis TaxID=1117645 RepID=UPI00301CF2D2
MKSKFVNQSKKQKLIIASAILLGIAMQLKSEPVSAQTTNPVVVKPQEVKVDTVKTEFYETGVNIPSNSALYLDMKYDSKANKTLPVNKRLLFLNGKEVPAGTAGGLENAKLIIIIDSKKAIAKYGEKAKFGAIDVFGDNVEILAMP